MKILFITLTPLNSNSSSSIRNRALIKGFVENGHEVDVLTVHTQRSNPYFNGDSQDKRYGNQIILNEASLGNENERNVDNIFKKLLKRIIKYTFHKLSIFDGTFVYINQAKLILSKGILKPKYDRIISSSDPKTAHVLTNGLLKNGLEYGEWIQYWGDPLSIDITNKTIYPKFALRYFEKKLFANADKIVYVSPFTLKEQKKIFPQKSEEMHFLPVPYSERKIYPLFSNESVKIVSYLGDYPTKIRNILPLYKSVDLFNSKVKLIIAGNSDCDLAEKSNIEVYKRLNEDALREKEALSDILICLLNSKGSQIPGKLYHYAATNKPIIVILDGEYQKEIAEYLNEFSRFVLCENNEESIYKAVTSVLKDTKTYTPLEKLSATTIAEKILSI